MPSAPPWGMLNAQVMSWADTSYIDAALLERGRLRLLPKAYYDEINPAHLRLWLHLTARYSVPTVESIAYLRDRIGGRSAIEVGAGNGDLGYHLGILSTDSYQQQHDPQTVYAMQTHKQPQTNPPRDVLSITANDAVEFYRPQVVVASWLTHRYDGVDGNYLGPLEAAFLVHAETYLHIGSTSTHARKPLLRRPHSVTFDAGLVGRGRFGPGRDVVFEWSCNK